MRIGVVGAGALGSLLAARLQLAGHDVQVVTRGEQRDTIAAHGISLRGGFGDATVRVRVVERFAPVDLCLVCVKVHDTAEALANTAECIGDAPVVLVQNGVDGLTIARQWIEPARIFGAISMIAANFTELGTVTVTNPQPTFIGRGSGPADDESHRIAAVLNDAIPTTAIDEFEGALWTKLIFNMQNALPAITGLSVQEVANNRTLATVLAASMREAAQVGIAAGIPFARIHGLDETVVTSLAGWPLWRIRRMVRAIARGMGPIPNLASMLQSIRRGRPTEIEFLNGAIVRMAGQLRRDVPVNRAIISIVHEVESSGRHLSVAELRTALRERGARI